MNDRTLGLIYTIKGLHKPNWFIAVAKYMSMETDTPEDSYTYEDCYKIIKEAFFDYISTCDNIRPLLYTFFDRIEHDGASGTGEKIVGALAMEKVRDKDSKTGEYYYVNGFREPQGEVLKILNHLKTGKMKGKRKC